jgi:hypothetical protein
MNSAARGYGKLPGSAAHPCLLASVSSPAINAANGSFYSFVTDDMDGQARAGSRDIGADELSVATILRRPGATADVGPNAP